MSRPKPRLLLSALFALALLITGFAEPVRASAMHRGGGEEIRDTIDAQIEALRQGDFAGAFGYASAGIHRQFGTVENFEAMLKGGYPMVIAPRERFYMQQRREASRRVQPVQMEDDAGQLFTLEYLMVNTPAGWKIDAVRLMQVVKPSA